jgi:hypothetical protein
MSDVKPPTTLFGALFVGGIPLLLGAAAMYFTSGVTFRCERVASGQVTCTEGRRVFKLFDVPLRRYQDVRGAVAEERTAYDEDGDPYKKSVLVLSTAGGRTELAPSGAGGSLEDLVASVDAYAKHPTPEGLEFETQAGGMVFFFHLFSSIFVLSGVWTFGGYLRHLLGRLRPGPVQ